MVKMSNDQFQIQFFAHHHQTMEQASAVQTAADRDDERQPALDIGGHVQAMQGATQALKHATLRWLGVQWVILIHATDYSTGSEHAAFTSHGQHIAEVGLCPFMTDFCWALKRAILVAEGSVRACIGMVVS
jgi:hypothetical protein